MATKTLGIKFQVAGVKEAQASLNNLKNSLNSSVAQSKKAVAQSLKHKNMVGKGEPPYDYIDNYQRTVKAVKSKRYRQAADTYFRPRVNAGYGGYVEGVGSAAGERTFNKLDDLFRRLTGRQEYRETVELGNETIRKLALTIRNPNYFEQGKKPSQRDINLGFKKQSSSLGAIGSIIEQALLPIKTMQYSFYEGVGSNFGNRFAEGLNEVLNEDLDLSFERKGKVTGKAISYTTTSGLEQFNQDAARAKDNYNQFKYAVEDGRVDEVAHKFDTLFKSIIKSVTGIGDSYVKGFRRGSVQIEALRKIDAEIAKQENFAPDLTGKKKVIYTVGGFAGEKGQRGKAIAKQLKPLVNDETEVIGAENTFTDVNTPAQNNALMWGVNSLANVAKINLKGFNPDAVKLAAQVVNTLAKNPDVVVDLVGHSAGGFVVEEAQEILNLLGKGNKVKSKTVGTPNTRGGINADGTTRVMGDKDPFSDVERSGEYIGVSEPTENIAKGVQNHSFQAYLDSDDFVDQILGDSLDPDRLKTQRQKNSKFQGKLIELETLYTKYISTIYQNLDDLGEELSIAPDRLVAKSRRGKLRDRGVNELDKKLERQDYKKIELKEGVETAVLVSGGFGGARGRSGAKFAKGVGQLVDDDKTQYVGVRNPFTDIFKPDDVRNPDAEKTIPMILDMFAEVHAKGYNPDAVEIAAQVMDLLAKDPNLKVKFAGYSGGGYVAEDVMELLKAKEVDLSRVEVMGIGTPDLPGGIKNREFKKMMGEQDPVMMANKLKEINNEFRTIIGFDIFPELMAKLQNIEGVETHDINEYIANSKEIQDFFYGHIPQGGELVGNYGEINSLQKRTAGLSKEMNEISENKSLQPAEKLARLHDIKEEYISLLKQIHALAKYSQSIGGGQAFANEREVAVLELEDAGVIVDPIQIQVSDDDPWEDTEEQEAEVINNRAKVLSGRYKAYLESLITTKHNDLQTNRTISQDFKNLDKSSQQNYIETMRRAFILKARLFRSAVKTGQLEIAREQGEKLLKLSVLMKQLYADIDSDSEIDGEVKSKLKGLSGYVTSVQNEVISGSGGKGRVSEGLTQNFESQLNLAQEDGENVAEGFIYGILDTLAAAEDAGEELVNRVDKGIRKEGEINSPSRLTQRLGRWFAQGFGLGMAAENMEQRGRDVVEDAASGIQEQMSSSLDPDNLAKLLDTGGVGLIKKVGSLLFSASQNENFDAALDVIGKLIGKVARLVITFGLLKVGLDALGLGKFISAFRNLPEEALNAAVAVEALDNRIIQMSGSAVSGAKNLEFITNEAKRLNRNLTDAKENFSQILRATRDTSLEGFQSENIYTAFAATAKANALSQPDEQQLFRSVRSMIGKGILSQEEVRQEIGERLGDFEQSLAEAYGVSRPQLNKMIENRQVIATEALPKVAAVLRAKNDIGGELNTGAAAAQRTDNAIVSFRESVGEALLPLQKFGNNFLADFFNMFAHGVNLLKPLVHGFFIALFVNLLRLQILGHSVQKMLLGIIKLLWTMKGALGIFLAEMVLVAAAWQVWANVLKIFNSRFFPEINKDIDQLTRGMKAYRTAIDEARDSQNDLNNTKLQLAEGFKLPENKFGEAIAGFIGSDYLNLDSLVRNPINNLYGGYQNWVASITGTESSNIKLFKPVRELKEEQLKIDNSRLSLKGNQLLEDDAEAMSAAKKITEYDAQIAEIQSERSRLLPGDIDGLKASLAEEQKINKQRDKQLRILTSYQQTLTSSIGVYKKRLEDIEQRFLAEEIDDDTYKTERGNLQGLLSVTEDELKTVNNEISRVSKVLTLFQRKLRNSNERVEGFLTTSDRQLQLEKAGIIESGIAQGVGTQTIQVELEEAQQRDLQNRINFIKAELSEIEKELDSPELNPAVTRIKQRLESNNIPLNETTLQRIIDESTVQADRDAAQGLLDGFKRETQLAQLSEQFAQTLQSNHNLLLDYNRTIDDYFFRLNQQIKEARVEVLRVLDQIINSQIKNQLQSALSPNANSFVNQLISSTQSLLDQAASYAERVLGQRGARIQFATQERSLQVELQDFARNVGGASDALLAFEKRLRGESDRDSSTNTVTSTNNQRSSNSYASSSSSFFAGKTKQIAQRLGIDPHALMTIMLFESAGTLDPKIQGPVVPGQGRGRGLIQFMPATARGLGTSDVELASMTDIEQLDYVEKYFAQFQGNFGAGKLENLYAAVLAGNPLKVNASDGYTTAREGAKTMMKDFGERAKLLLDDSNRLAVPSVPNFTTTGSLPLPPGAEDLNNQLIDKQRQKLDLEDSLIQNQEKEALEIAIANNLKSDRQKVDFNITDSQFALDKLLDAGKDLESQYDFTSSANEAAKSIRAVNTAFSDRGLQLSREIIKYTDEINAINDLITKAPSQVRMLRNAGMNDEADIIVEKVAQAQLLLKPYQDILKGLTAEYQNNVELAQVALQYTIRQNELKKEQENYNRRSLLLNQKATITEARGTLEAQRKVKLHQEDLRLALKINELRQQNAPGEYLDSLIAGERRQSRINTENINHDGQLAELELEKKLLDIQGQIDNKNAGFKSRLGNDLGSASLKKNNAIAAENLRFERELVELRKLYQDRPEELERFARAATELNRVNLASIENEFKSLGKTIEDYFIGSTQGFFDKFVTEGISFVDRGAIEQQELEERLRYAEELNQLENQHRDEPGKLAHLKNRARELNEEKLDKIRNEFNLFSRTVDLAKQAVMEFVKQLAAMVARAAAAKFLSSILGGVVGGVGGGGVAAVGNDYGSGAGIGAFVADEGITVGESNLDSRFKRGNPANALSRKISDRNTSIFRRSFPGIAKAWSAEGSDAQLGVFHTGEELLSRKTGEASRYQMLKREYGIDPLSKVLNYAEGGTIGDVGSNILSGFSPMRPRIDLSALNSRGRNSQPTSSKTINLQQTIYTDSADSFRLNEDQRNQDLMEKLRRGI